MKKILYIHGYNSSSESRTAQVLLAHLGEGFELIHPTFSNDPEEAIPMARRIIREEGVDMVVATSLGGFVALILRGIPKFVINPSVAPHLTLPNNGYDGDLSGFEKLSKVIWDDIDEAERTNTTGLFGLNDELFSYRDIFSTHYAHVIETEDSHHVLDETITDIVIPHIHSYFGK